MDLMIVGVLFFAFIICFILYNLIRSAVKEGTLEALVEYDKIKKKVSSEE